MKTLTGKDDWVLGYTYNPNAAVIVGRNAYGLSIPLLRESNSLASEFFNQTLIGQTGLMDLAVPLGRIG